MTVTLASRISAVTMALAAVLMSWNATLTMPQAPQPLYGAAAFA